MVANMINIYHNVLPHPVANATAQAVAYWNDAGKLQDKALKGRTP
jgi:hypothetical protein